VKPTIFATSIVAMVLAAQLGCSGADPTAPEATEPLNVTVTTRERAPGEASPAVHASSVMGDLLVRVTRPALCGTQVRAAVNRAPLRVDIVSHVSPDPGANCSAAGLSSYVVDYVGTVGSLPPGSYVVRVFEGAGDESPRFLGSATVSLSAFVCPACSTQ
jgi:hypothetical protein